MWGVGNENWGCGGNFDAASYAHEYRRYATMLRHVDPTAELVACGHDDAWNVKLLEVLGRHTRLADHLSIHRYWNRSGHATDFNDEQYYALLTEAHATEDFVRDTAQIIQDAVPSDSAWASPWTSGASGIRRRGCLRSRSAQSAARRTRSSRSGPCATRSPRALRSRASIASATS